MWTLNLNNLRENVKLDLFELWMSNFQTLNLHRSARTGSKSNYNKSVSLQPHGGTTMYRKMWLLLPLFSATGLVFLLQIKFTSVQWQKVLYLSKYLTLGFKVQQILQKNTYPGDNHCLLMNLNVNHVVLSAELGTTKTDWTIYPGHQTNGTWRLSLHNNSSGHVGQVLFSRSIHWLNQKPQRSQDWNPLPFSPV